MKKLLSILLMSLSLFGLDFSKNDVLGIEGLGDMTGVSLDKFAEALVSVNKRHKEHLKSIDGIAKELKESYLNSIYNGKTLVNQWVDLSTLSQEMKETLRDGGLSAMNALNALYDEKKFYIILLSALMKDCVTYSSDNLANCMSNMADTYYSDDSYYDWLSDAFSYEFIFEVNQGILDYIDVLKKDIKEMGGYN